MKRKVFVFIIFITCFHFSFSQNQTNFWYFGVLAGVDFTGGSPAVVTNGAINTSEGVASIADSAGNLLFYTEGINVYNRNNVQMPNGFGLLGDVSTTQTIIVPNPGNSNLFYIFTLDDEGGPDGFNYSVVDMSLQGGDGDVTIKNSFLHSSMTEKLAATYHCNNHDIWVMTHEWFSNNFLAYLVTDSGISAPVVSSIGLNHTDVHGQLKFNNAADKIACTRDTVISPFPSYLGIAAVDLFDFNNITGIVSNPVLLTLNNHQNSYGIEFSPDNSKLYVTFYDVTGVNGGTSGLAQFNMTASSIDSSKLTVATSFDQDMYALQMASDNKIYVSRNIKPFISVVNNPNLTGGACNFVDNPMNLDPGGMGLVARLGLPGFVQSFFNPSFPNIPCITSTINANFSASDTLFCRGQCINFTDTSTGPVTSRAWTFSGATPSSSSAVNPVNICYPSTGTFNVRLIVSDGSSNDTIIKTVTVVPTPVVDAGADVTIAGGDSVTLHATGTATSYSWTPSTGLSATNIADPVATPSVTTTYTVMGTGSNNCIFQDEVTVFVDETPCGNIFIPTAFSPNSDGENDIECVLGDCIVTMHFAIYDRWGEKVFETSDQNDCWDGTYKGELMNTASFVYYFNAILTSGEEISQKGNISLIR